MSNDTHKKERTSEVMVPPEILSQWQTILDTLAELCQVPAALIMRMVNSDIEVFVSSKTSGNPYNVGNSEKLIGSGLYCETVIRTKKKLLVPNALKDKHWKNNPDIKLNMISYLGFPLLMPNGEPFGTICVLDNKGNAHSKAFEHLVDSFRYIVEAHLALLYMNFELGDENKRLNDYISEIKTLRGILPVCSLCKKIRNDDGTWNPIESYISDRSEAQFSHTFCPECLKKWSEQQGIALE